MVKKNGFIELTAFDTIPKLFVDSPEEVAVCTFFTQFILIPTHPDGHRGFLECLLPLYTSTRHDSLLSLSTTAVALAISGGSPLRKSDYRLGRSYFTTALGMATTVIQDSEKSVKDETLMAVLLLAFFEVGEALPFVFYPATKYSRMLAGSSVSEFWRIGVGCKAISGEIASNSDFLEELLNCKFKESGHS